jgi:hypothetical protein
VGGGEQCSELSGSKQSPHINCPSFHVTLISYCYNLIMGTHMFCSGPENVAPML